MTSFDTFNHNLNKNTFTDINATRLPSLPVKLLPVTSILLHNSREVMGKYSSVYKILKVYFKY